MTENSIAARRDGELVAIETVVDDTDFRGVANTSYLDADAAIRFGQGLVALGRQIKARPVKEMPLARAYDPHTGDRG